MPVSRGTVLRLVDGLPESQPRTPRVVGVDEYAMRKDRVHGTVLVDVETGRPVDLLPDREATTLAAWLSKRPGIEVICRDRAPFFAEGARFGAPTAVQVADRSHLWHNLGEAAERCVSRHRSCLRAPFTLPRQKPAKAPQEADGSITTPWPTGHRFADRTREEARNRPRAAVQGLQQTSHRPPPPHDPPGSQAPRRRCRPGRPVSRPMAKPTHEARRLQALPARTMGRGLDECVGPLGGDQISRVRRRIRNRTCLPPPLPRIHTDGRSPTNSSDRHEVDPDPPQALQENDRLKLKSVLVHCPELEALARHIRAFAQILTQLQGDRLLEWLTAVRADGLPSMHTFVNGLERDLNAVIAGLTLPWNSRIVEGHVNRIKMIKHQMYGRAGFRLLRKGVLLS
ncbi:ISL3 family transposase [Streptomyces sp. B15]|uniref:ISL3 family transposase n=1 Tax=Streptomyces sp. B15 TaxID=1537797 RepID=UPI0027DDC384|nr:ISL3 family transposase [Streptomyces sp. B15]